MMEMINQRIRIKKALYDERDEKNSKPTKA